MLSRKDLLVLSSLRRNSRETLTQISKNIHVPISSIYDNIREHENELIKKHTCLIDFSQLGFNARANILLKVDRDSRDEIRNFLTKHQNINTAYKINSGWDFMIEGIFVHIKELEEFVEDLEQKFKIKQKQVFYIIEDIKREEFLADPQLVDLFEKPAQ